MKARYLVLGLAVVVALWATGAFALHQVRLRQFESGPTPAIQFVKDVRLDSASDDGEVFGGSINRSDGKYELNTACLWTTGEGITRLPTDKFCQSSIIRVSSDGKSEIGSMEWGDDIPHGGKGDFPSYQCVWRAKTLESRIAFQDSTPAVSENGSWLAYNTYDKPKPEFGFLQEKDVRIRSSSSAEIVLTNVPLARPYAISNDGHVVVGSLTEPSPSLVDSGRSIAVVWIRGQPIRLSNDNSWSTACSEDGTWVVGVVMHDGKLPERGFRWSLKSGFELLPEAEGHDVWPNAITADGKTIVVNSFQHVPGSKDVVWNGQTGAKDNSKEEMESENRNYFHKAYIWREGVGMLPLKDYLTKRGAHLGSNDKFSDPAYITPDGHTIICWSSQNWVTFSGSWIIRI